MGLTPSIPLTLLAQGPLVQGRTPDPRMLRGAPPGRVGLGPEPSLSQHLSSEACPYQGHREEAQPVLGERTEQCRVERRCGRVSCGPRESGSWWLARCVPIRTGMGQGKLVQNGAWGQRWVPELLSLVQFNKQEVS